MSFLWAGTTLDQMGASQNMGEVAQTGDAYCDVRIQGTTGTTDYADTPDLGVDLTNHWHSFRLVNDNANSGVPWALYDASGVGVVRLQRTSSLDRFQYWNGSAWVDLSATPTLVNFANAKMNVYYKHGASGILQLYKNDILVTNFNESGNYSGHGTPRFVRYQRYSSSNNSGTMEMIVADESLIGHRFVYQSPETNGANTDWTNDVAAIDESNLDTNDYIYSTTAGDRETVKSSSRATPLSTHTIKAVVVSHMSAKGTTGPTKVETQLRIGSTNYDSGQQDAMLYGFTGKQHMWTTDPSTGIAWTPTNAADANLEYGVKSVT